MYIARSVSYNLFLGSYIVRCSMGGSCIVRRSIGRSLKVWYKSIGGSYMVRTCMGETRMRGTCIDFQWHIYVFQSKLSFTQATIISFRKN